MFSFIAKIDSFLFSSIMMSCGEEGKICCFDSCCVVLDHHIIIRISNNQHQSSSVVCYITCDDLFFFTPSPLGRSRSFLCKFNPMGIKKDQHTHKYVYYIRWPRPTHSHTETANRHKNISNIA